MKTFHINSKTQIAYLILFLFMFAAMGGSLYFVFSMFSITTGDILIRSLFYFLVAFLTMPILMASWTGYIFYAVRKAKLTFDENGIHFTSIPTFNRVLPPWLKPFNIAYRDIKKIEPGKLQPFLRIESQRGSAIILFPTIFDNRQGKDVLEEFQTRIPSESFEGTLSTSLLPSKWRKANAIQAAVGLLLLLAMTITVMFDKEFSFRSVFTKAWTVQQRFPLFQDIEAFTMKSQSDYWVVTDKFDQYSVYHFTDGKEERLEHPPVETEESVNFVSAIGTNPVVWMKSKIFYHNGLWQSIPYENNMNFPLAYINGYANEDRMWVINKLDDRYQILEVDAVSGNVNTIPLPTSVIKDNLSPQLIRGSNEKLLVLMWSKEISRVNVYSNDKWAPQEYVISRPDKQFVQDFFLDAEDNLWVLLGTPFGDNFIVEKVSLTGETLITQLTPPSRINDYDRYDRFLIDFSGRMWISGSYPPFISVFQPKWNEEAEILQTFSEDNSNYRQNSETHPILFPDGTIWSFGDHISIIDSNSEILPAPLPDWLSNLNMQVVRLIIMSAYLPYILYLLWLQIRSQTLPRK